MSPEFYSSRKERLSHASSATKRAYVKRNNKGFFKRNPHLKILVIDLLLVLLFAVIIIPFFIRITKDIRVDDYKVESKAILFEDTILVSVKISKLVKRIVTKKTDNKVQIQLLNEDMSLFLEKEDFFPIEHGNHKYITFKLEDNENIEIINIRIISGSFVKDYNIRVER